MLIEISPKFCRDHSMILGYEVKPVMVKRDGIEDIFYQAIFRLEDEMYYAEAHPTEKMAVDYAREIKDKVNSYHEQAE